MDSYAVAPSFAIGYQRMVADCIVVGEHKESRLGPMTELVGAAYRFFNPYFSIPMRDKFSYDFMKAEILLLLAGRYDDETLRRAVPKAADLIRPATAYGPRTKEQMFWIVNELAREPNTRRAVVYVGRESDLALTYDPSVDSERAHEMPCTMTWQFVIRHGALDMIVNMRSWDLIWGASYDVPSFSAVQIMVAATLGIPVGRYTHFAGSAHVYHETANIPIYSDMENAIPLSAVLDPHSFAPQYGKRRWGDVVAHAEKLLEHV